MASAPHLRWGTLGLMLAALAGCAPQPAQDPFTASGEVIAMGGGDAGAMRACFGCHGLRGEGDGQTAPRLAGLPTGYLQKQLEDYAAGLRPHPLMRSVAGALDSDDRRKVAAYYGRLPAPPPASGPREPVADGNAAALYHRGDPARGLPACASCHGDAGEGQGPANPPLAGQPVAYLEEQMAQWRRSERRNDPQGAMLAVSRLLTPAEVEGLARYAAAPGPAGAPPSGSPAASP